MLLGVMLVSDKPGSAMDRLSRVRPEPGSPLPGSLLPGSPAPEKQAIRSRSAGQSLRTGRAWAAQSAGLSVAPAHHPVVLPHSPKVQQRGSPGPMDAGMGELSRPDQTRPDGPVHGVDAPGSAGPTAEVHDFLVHGSQVHRSQVHGFWAHHDRAPGFVSHGS